MTALILTAASLKFQFVPRNGVAHYVLEGPATLSYSRFQNCIIIETNSATEMLLYAARIISDVLFTQLPESWPHKYNFLASHMKAHKRVHNAFISPHLTLYIHHTHTPLHICITFTFPHKTSLQHVQIIIQA
jgi:hypothetical protein